MYLLDINVLIALVDPDHVHHDFALAFFQKAKGSGWATCPITENGFLRILGSSQYDGGPGSPELARKILFQLCLQPGHQFWEDSISLREIQKYSVLPSSKHLTDFYLLALASKHHSKLATLDQGIDPHLLTGGVKSYYLISK